jgi:glutamate carboxypeptidase
MSKDRRYLNRREEKKKIVKDREKSERKTKYYTNEICQTKPFMRHEPLKIRLEQFLQAHLGSAKQLLQKMVAVNSFTANPEGINQLGQLTAAEFAPLGFEPTFVPCTNWRFGQHLVLVKPGRSGRVLGFISHLDTVYPNEEEIANQFFWREEVHPDHTRLYGPGTSDIKGGTVLWHLMFSALQQEVPELYEELTLVLLLNAAEEYFVDDFRVVCKQFLPQDKTIACLVFETGPFVNNIFNLVVARKGMARYRLETRGRAAHAGAMHEMGANAIVQLAEIAQKITAMTNYDKRLTFNVGVFNGGVVVNRVPHQAEMHIEFRSFDLGVFQEAVRQIEAFRDYSTVSSPADGYKCQTFVYKQMEHAPWPPNAGSQKLFAIWQKTAEELGYQAEPEERGGLSDGNPLWDYVPLLDGLGPDGRNEHSSERSADGSKDQEYVILDSFVPKALLNVLAIVALTAE